MATFAEEGTRTGEENEVIISHFGVHELSHTTVILCVRLVHRPVSGLHDKYLDT